VNQNLLQLAFLALVVLGLIFYRLMRQAPAWEARWSHVGRGSAFMLGGLTGGLLTAFVLAGAWQAQPASGAGQGQGAPVALPAGAGRDLFTAKGCPTCHTIAGFSQGTVGPELSHVGSRQQIAGTLPMDRANLVKWLMDPPAAKPGTQMPKLGLSEQEAGQLADWLVQLK
jgi:cytochrome c oxidase subunit 2